MRTLVFRNDMQGHILNFVCRALLDGYEKFSMAVDESLWPGLCDDDVVPGIILYKLEHAPSEVTGTIVAIR